MISLLLIRLLFDFGLLVLIWIVQLVIYPSFLYYQSDRLLAWHHSYTQRISLVVFPLMLGQMSTAGIQLWQVLSWYTISSAFLIALLWLSTFLQFVPLHQRISNNNFDQQTLQALGRNNWFRTVLWTLLFVSSLLQMRA